MCGLKLASGKSFALVLAVTPFVGVWIETLAHVNDDKKTPVTPFVGVWIETSDVNQPTRRTGSHTLRGCVD